MILLTTNPATGSPGIDPRWTRFAFPTDWHYDVLRALDYLRADGAAPDERLTEAIELVEKRRQAEGGPDGGPPVGSTSGDTKQ